MERWSSLASSWTDWREAELVATVNSERAEEIAREELHPDFPHYWAGAAIRILRAMERYAIECVGEARERDLKSHVVAMTAANTVAREEARKEERERLMALVCAECGTPLFSSPIKSTNVAEAIEHANGPCRAGDGWITLAEFVRRNEPSGREFERLHPADETGEGS
jgi:hypothetical protein